MQTVYNLNNLMDFFTIASATTDVAIYGIGGQLDISSYAYNEDICFRLSFMPKYGKDHVNGALIDQTVRVQKSGLLGKRTIEQKYEISSMVLEGTNFRQARELTSEDGVEDAFGLITNFYAFIEQIRSWVRDQTSDAVRDDVFKRIDSKIYAIPTIQLYEELLQDINWLFLFQGFHDTDYAKAFAESIEEKGSCDYCPLSSEERTAPSPDVLRTGDKVLEFVQANRTRIISEQQRLIGQRAGIVARRLLEKVCGEEKAQEFDKSGCITVEKDGWKYRLNRSGGEISSPKGKRAYMCVHTRKMDCHHIDEIVIKYLYIKSDTLKFLKTANIGGDSGFVEDLEDYKNQLMKQKVRKRRHKK